MTYSTPVLLRIKYRTVWYIHCVSKKVPTFKLCVTLSNLNRFSKFCTAEKRMKFAKNPYDNTHLTLGMLLHYLGKLKSQISFPAVKKIWKSVNIWQSYREFKGGKFFLRHSVFVDMTFQNLCCCNHLGMSIRDPWSNEQWFKNACCTTPSLIGSGLSKYVSKHSLVLDKYKDHRRNIHRQTLIKITYKPWFG